MGRIHAAGRKKNNRSNDIDSTMQLPLPPIARWMPRHKAALAAAVIDGRITPDRVMSIYGVSPEESARWVALYKQYSQPGLKTTYCQLFSRRAICATGVIRPLISSPDSVS